MFSWLHPEEFETKFLPLGPSNDSLIDFERALWSRQGQAKRQARSLRNISGLLALHLEPAIGDVGHDPLSEDAAEPRTRVDRAQAREHRLHALREPVVGQVLVREEGVAAGLGDVEGVEGGAEGRALGEGHVGVPDLGEALLLAAVRDRDDQRVTGQVGE